MRYISLDDATQYRFNDTPAKRKIADAVKNYVAAAVSKDEVQTLNGLSLVVKNLDDVDIVIGGGIVGSADSLYKIVWAKVQMCILDVKQQLVAGEKFPGDYVPEDVTGLRKIMENGTPADTAVAAAMIKYVNVAADLHAGLSPKMRSRIKSMLETEEASKVNDTDSMLYNETWFKKHIDDIIAVNAKGVTDTEKKLINCTVAVCKKFEELGINSAKELVELSKGKCVRAYGIKYMGSKRAATRSEIERHVGNLFMGSANMLEDPDLYRLALLLMLATGAYNYKYELEKLCDSENIKKMGEGWAVCLNRSEDVVSFVRRCGNTIAARVKEIEGVADYYVKQLNMGHSEIVYPETVATSGVYITAAGYTLEEMFTAIKNKGNSKNNALAYKISKECLDNGKTDVSEKQLDVLTRAYVGIIYGDATEKPSADVAQALEIAKKLVDNYSIKLSKIESSIANGVISKGKCSPKQFDVLKRTLDKVENANSKPGLGRTMSVEQLASKLFNEEVQWQENSVEKLASKLFDENVGVQDSSASENKATHTKENKSLKENEAPKNINSMVGGISIPKPVFETEESNSGESVDSMLSQWFS